jgi:hypothetical protein
VAMMSILIFLVKEPRKFQSRSARTSILSETSSSDNL